MRTIVEVTQIPGIEEEVRPEEVTKAPFAWPEGQGGVEMEPPSPVRLATQVVTCHTTVLQSRSKPYHECLIYL